MQLGIPSFLKSFYKLILCHWNLITCLILVLESIRHGEQKMGEDWKIFALFAYML